MGTHASKLLIVVVKTLPSSEEDGEGKQNGVMRGGGLLGGPLLSVQESVIIITNIVIY